MKILKNKLISRKLIYALTLIVATAGIMFLTIKMYSKVEITKNLLQCSNKGIITMKTSDNTEETTLGIANVEQMRETTLKTTSRGSTETRTDTKDVNEEIKESENNEAEQAEKTSTTTNNTTSSNTNSKTTTSTSKTTTSKSTSTNKSSKSTTTKSKSTSKTTTKSSTTSSNSTSSNGKIKISKDMDLTVRTGLSRDEFIKLIAGVEEDTSGFFEENAGEIYDLCEEYSINEVFFCGLISAESGWNIASNHRRTHNYISLMKNGKLISYSSVSEGLEVAAKKLHTNYLTKGGAFYHGKTLAGVKTNFCPSSSTWVNLVYGRMKQIVS